MSKNECEEMNVKLVICYDGTCYLGWQKTKMGSSIEGTLQKALQTILQEEITLQAASRTDARVHAKKQTVQFYTKKSFSLSDLAYRLNQILPKEIAVLEAMERDQTFHPTLECKRKVYHYAVCFGKVQMPHNRHYSWHFPYVLDIQLMQRAAELFIGSHDFSTFCNNKKNASYKDRLCHIFRVDIVSLPQDRLQIEIEGDRFLYKMARNIAGTLVYVGCGKIDLEEVTEVMKSGLRARAGMTAPAHGLTLFDQIF